MKIHSEKSNIEKMNAVFVKVHDSW